MKTTPSLSWKLKRFDSQLLSIYTVKRKFILGISRCMYRYLLWVKMYVQICLVGKNRLIFIFL